MSEAYVGEIRMVGFNFAPVNWALCNGQLLSISQNTALFSLLGTYYGGNGTTNFALPDLQGRIPLHAGNGAGLPPYVIGESGGAANTVLQYNNMPLHSHPIAQPVSNVAATSNSPVGAYPALLETTVEPAPLKATAATKGYAASSVANQMAATYQSGMAGGGVPISNQPPFLAVYFVICLFGLYPTRG